MALKDLSGKTAYDLDREDFETLFCKHCHEYEECPQETIRRYWAAQSKLLLPLMNILDFRSKG